MTTAVEKPTKKDELLLHRVERFAELGFDADQSFALGEAKDSKGFALYWGDVQKALNNGATHEQAYAIYS